MSRYNITPVHVLVVSGTRPEIVKLAPLYHCLRDIGVRVTWLHTGQHDDIALPAFRTFDITPDLAWVRAGASLAEFSAGCREQLERVLRTGGWSALVVQGDTESTFQGALAGFHHKVPVAHVEAGLRTYDLAEPFPEEGIRQMVTRIARFHFAPTEGARQALLREGIGPSRVVTTGNTVVDAQHWVARRWNIRRTARERGHLLVTVHRRENWDRLDDICDAIRRIAIRRPELPVLIPLHPNPTLRARMTERLQGLATVRLLPPLEYVQMQQALADAWLVLSDSGGLQEEAPTYGVPILVLREETERPEAIQAGCAALVGTSPARIVEAVSRLWRDEEAYRRMQPLRNPFGDGTASRRIANVLLSRLGAAAERTAAVRAPGRFDEEAGSPDSRQTAAAGAGAGR